MNMKKIIFGVCLGIIGVVAVAVIAWFFKFNFLDDDIVAPETNKPVETVTTTKPVVINLGDKSWTWVNTESDDGEVFAPKTDRFTLSFKDDGKVSVGTDCNSMGGQYMAKDGTLTFSQMITTLMYCEGSQQSQFSQYLDDVVGYSFNNSGELMLSLKDNGGTMLFR
jgi:heat shock protein HslJ